VKKIWIAQVSTESGDRYSWPYKEEPSRTEVIKRLWLEEGQCEGVDWYDETTSVRIMQEELK
jgi:hypothetical protein